MTSRALSALSGPLPLAVGLPLLAGIVVALVPGPGLWPLLALLVGSFGLMAVVRWPWILVVMVVLSSALAGLLRGLEQDVGGGLSGGGLRTLAVAAIVGIVGLLRIRQLRLWPALLPWAVFSAWCAVWWLATGAARSGLKDVALYALPLAIAVVAGAVMVDAPVRSRERLDRMILLSLAVPLVVYAITIPTGLVQLTANGPKGVIGARPVATYALLILCVAIPRWRYRMAPWRIGRIASLVALGLVAFTFSRLALATAPVLLLIGNMRPGRLAGSAVRLGVAGGIALVLLLSLPGVSERMFTGEPEELSDIPEMINLSGRDLFWSVTLSRWKEAPWFGQGPGYLRRAIADSRYWPGRELPPREYPPHNEYLQVLHDEGVFGVLLLSMALAAPWIWHYRRWAVADRDDPVRASAHLAALLGLTVVILNSAADNTLHYLTVTGPVFLFLASARGLEVGGERRCDRASEGGAR